MDSKKASKLQGFMAAEWPSQSEPIQRFLAKAFPIIDDAEVICDNVLCHYTIRLLYHKHSFGITVPFDAMHNTIAAQNIADELEKRLVTIAKAEFESGIEDPLKKFSTGITKEDLDKILSRRVSGIAAFPSISDSTAVHLEPGVHLCTVEERNEKTELEKKYFALFEKVKKELSARGDFEFDVVSFVDLLIKLGVAKPKD